MFSFFLFVADNTNNTIHLSENSLTTLTKIAEIERRKRPLKFLQEKIMGRSYPPASIPPLFQRFLVLCIAPERRTFRARSILIASHCLRSIR